MAYRIEKVDKKAEIVIDGWESGIAASPYSGIANIRNMNTSYYPGVAYTNYARKGVTITGGAFFYAGIHSVNVSNNTGWIFAANGTLQMGNPIQKATSPSGYNYILDQFGQILKQSAPNSSTFSFLGGGTGRYAMGASGIAYWNNYLVVFGSGVIEFCGDGTGDASIISSNWNKTNYGSALNTATFNVDTGTSTTNLVFFSLNKPIFTVNDPVQFTTTGTLPAPLTLNTTYYIISINPSTNVATISTTLGGSALVFTSNGTGTHTITDNTNPLPFGNSTNFIFNAQIGATSGTIISYTSPKGVAHGASWGEASGIYAIVMPDGQKMQATLTYGSATIEFANPIIYLIQSSNYTVELIDLTVSFYRPYVSKVDGNLYFCNGILLGKIDYIQGSENIAFNPAIPASQYVVQNKVIQLPQLGDTIIDMVDLNTSLIIAGQKDMYTWDYLSSGISAPSPVGELISSIVVALNNIYITAGKKGNLYVSNGYSAQLLFKMPDFISGIIDPIWAWGGIMVHRSKLWFQALVQSPTGTNVLSGIFSLIVSPSLLNEKSAGLVMEAQNSFGLTPASGSLQNGILIDNEQWSTGPDSYYSAWSNGSLIGGIDYNDTTPWTGTEPTIETDLIPLGSILNKQTLENISFKLDRPMTTGDQIQVYWRQSLTDSYTFIWTSALNQLSDYHASTISQAQWAQFKIVVTCASSSSSFIPIRELRLHLP